MAKQETKGSETALSVPASKRVALAKGVRQQLAGSGLNHLDAEATEEG
jgi:hypothetical protein